MTDLFEGDEYVSISVVYPTLIKQIHKLAGIQLETQQGMQIRNELVDNIEIRFSLNDEAFLGCMSVHTIASVFDPRFKMLVYGTKISKSGGRDLADNCG